MGSVEEDIFSIIVVILLTIHKLDLHGSDHIARANDWSIQLRGQAFPPVLLLVLLAKQATFDNFINYLQILRQLGATVLHRPCEAVHCTGRIPSHR